MRASLAISARGGRVEEEVVARPDENFNTLRDPKLLSVLSYSLARS